MINGILTAPVFEGVPPEAVRTGGRKGSAEWQAVADVLRARPGEWAHIAEGTNGGIAGSIKNGVLVAFRPRGDFEAVQRRDSDDSTRWDVWARYVGTAEESTTAGTPA
jgi:hypothetical protein